MSQFITIFGNVPLWNKTCLHAFPETDKFKISAQYKINCTVKDE